MVQKFSLRKPIFIIILFLAIAWITGCHTMRKAEKAPPGSVFGNHITDRKVIKEIKDRYIDFQTVSARVKISLENDETRQDNITAYLRMKRDSIIWVSVRPVLGIEMARLEITPDSVKLVNNLKQTVYLKGAEAVQSLLKMPLDFELLQNLLIGNPAFIPQKISNLKTDSAYIYLTLDNRSVSNKYQWSINDFLLKSSRSQPENSPQYAEQQYHSYREAGPYEFSFDRDIQVQSDGLTHVQLRFDKVVFDREVNFPFHINPRYKIL